MCGEQMEKTTQEDNKKSRNWEQSGKYTILYTDIVNNPEKENNTPK